MVFFYEDIWKLHLIYIYIQKKFVKTLLNDDFY